MRPMRELWRSLSEKLLRDRKEGLPSLARKGAGGFLDLRHWRAGNDQVAQRVVELQQLSHRAAAFVAGASTMAAALALQERAFARLDAVAL